MNIETYANKLLLPTSRAEIHRWARYFYNYEPRIRDFVDFVYAEYDHPPTDEEITEVVKPYFKLLCYKDYIRQENAKS